MRSSSSLAPDRDDLSVRFDRLGRTGTFRDGALARWLDASLFVVGAGNLGGRLAVEAVRAGARVMICDPDHGATVNLGTQLVADGQSKVETVAAACDAVLPGRVVPLARDVREIGVGIIARAAVIIDASDDAALAFYLTGLSNGLAVPLLRLAVDGSGALELGRVACSHGGGGHACQVCPLDFTDLEKTRGHTPCPGGLAPGTPPTLAGGALGMVIAGLALLQAQRLVGGNDLERVLDREVLLDLSHQALVSLELRRSADCVSGHQRWDLESLGVGIDAIDVAGLFAHGRERLGVESVTIEPYGQPLSILAGCACGRQRALTGNRHGPAPHCDCGGRMQWRPELTVARLSSTRAEQLGILDASLASLGWPQGAMFVVRGANGPPVHLLLDPDSPARSP